MNDDLRAALKQYWGYEEFRPQQEEVVRSLLAGHDAAVVMPTGAGKSLIYQLSALLQPGAAVVVSPLIALMHDQARQLADMGVPAAALTSTMEPAGQRAVMREAAQGKYKLLYLSPERLVRDETLAWLERLTLSFFAVDEAHCISEWGHEFRPEYRQLKILRERFPALPICAFTASATRRVRHDILAQLGLRQPKTSIRSFYRPNLRYAVRLCDKKTRQTLLLRALAAHAGESVIVYAPTIADVGATVELLAARGIAAVAYHGQMAGEERQRNQELWMSDEVRVMVGTLAFGLGINKPAVRAVIHLGLPKSLEQFYQESGRAGRDGLPSDCVLLWQKKDTALQAYFIKQVEDADERRRSWERYRVMQRFVESEACRHRQVCLHFGETPKWERCGHCDNCGAGPGCLEKQEPRAAAAVPPPDDGLLEHLRQWRRKKAAELGVRAFLVLHDTTLAEIAARRPSSAAQLLGVSGIGTRKLAELGPDILAALAAYAQKEREEK